jgi:fluoride exporter
MSAYFWIWIALGSALGGISRHFLTAVVANRWGSDFPWGTLLVNVIGAFLIGVASVFAVGPGRLTLSPNTAQFCIVGVLGGFTTFSAFSLQTVQLMQASRWGAATFYIFGSVFLCVAGVALGQTIARLAR